MSILMGPDEQLLSIGHVKFAEDTGEVVAHSNFADAQTIRNILIFQAVTDKTRDFALPGGQGGEFFRLLVVHFWSMYS